MKALFIGRFQPLHKGHAELIRRISKEYQEFIIGVGSAHKSHEVITFEIEHKKYTIENPFTVEERIRMIKEFLKSEDIKNHRIYEIPDINLTSDGKEIILPLYSNNEDVGRNLNNAKVKVTPISGIELWVNHVISIVSKFDVVYSNNPLTKELFSKAGYSVKEFPLFHREKYSGKEIRRRMINGEQWENLVPPVVCNIIKEIDGVKRVKELSIK